MGRFFLRCESGRGVGCWDGVLCSILGARQTASKHGTSRSGSSYGGNARAKRRVGSARLGLRDRSQAER